MRIFKLKHRVRLKHLFQYNFLSLFSKLFCIFKKTTLFAYQIEVKYSTILNMIVVNLDVMMARRKMSLGELSDKVGITPANLSILKTGKAKAIRFSTLEAICRILDCQPGDILEYREVEETNN